MPLPPPPPTSLCCLGAVMLSSPDASQSHAQASSPLLGQAACRKAFAEPSPAPEGLFEDVGPSSECVQCVLVCLREKNKFPESLSSGLARVGLVWFWVMGVSGWGLQETFVGQRLETFMWLEDGMVLDAKDRGTEELRDNL